MVSDLPVLESGSFYLIKDADTHLILEDKTKRGLAIKETSADQRLDVKADKGMIHDMDGVGHKVPIRWYFSKETFDISEVMVHAQMIEKKYNEIREMTCPDDSTS